MHPIVTDVISRMTPVSRKRLEVLQDSLQGLQEACGVYQRMADEQRQRAEKASAQRDAFRQGLAAIVAMETSKPVFYHSDVRAIVALARTILESEA